MILLTRSATKKDRNGVRSSAVNSAMVSLNHWPIEIGLEHAPFVVLVYFFPSFEDAKNLLIMGPKNTKNSLLKCDFFIFNYE